MAPLDSAVFFWPNLGLCELYVVPEEATQLQKGTGKIILSRLQRPKARLFNHQ
jgi:hypothetical protein